MQQLHLVGFTTDLEGLIFSARKGAKSGGYLVMLDDRLRATIEDALRLREGDDAALLDNGDGPSSRPRRPRPQSTLSPREIQARLRTGSSIDEVAAEAGVDEEWVGRFAVPILAEQAQVVARARSLTFGKPRLGDSALPLGDAVRWNLADRDVRFLDQEFDGAWSAYSLQGASWVVRFHYTSRAKRQTAEWEVDLREGEVFARNRIASDLAYVDASRRRRRPPVLEPSPRETPATGGSATSRRDGSTPASSAAPASTSGSTTLASATKGAPRLPIAATVGRAGAASGTGAGRAGGAAGRKPAAGKKGAATKAAAAKKAAATKAAGTKRTATKAAPAKKAATKKAAAKKAATRKGVAAKAAATKARPGPAKASASGRGTSATRATGGRRGAGTSSTAPAARKAAKAASPTRRTTGAARGRTTKATGRSAKKPASERRRAASTSVVTRSAGSVGSPRAAAAVGAPAPVPPPPPEIAARRSHLARPASPMPTANRAPAPGTAGRPTPSPRTLAPTAGDRMSRDEGFRVLDRPDDGDVRLPPPRRPAVPPAAAGGDGAAGPPRRRPEQVPTPRPGGGSPPEAVRRPSPPPDARAERPGGPEKRPGEARRRPGADGSSGTAAAGPEQGDGRSTADQRLARRLATRQNGTERGGPRTPPPPPDHGDEPVWHGPGSGEPAPAVRIRADVAAAADVRPSDSLDSNAPPVRRRRERPLRAR